MLGGFGGKPEAEEAISLENGVARYVRASLQRLWRRIPGFRAGRSLYVTKVYMLQQFVLPTE